MIKKAVLSIAAIVFLVLAVIIINYGCKHEPNLTSVCFESDVLPIFQSNCAMSDCHSASGGRRGIKLDNYDDIIAAGITKGNANKSRVYTVLSGTYNSMPPNRKLTGTQLAYIYTWIQTGAENTTGCGPVDTTHTVACDTTNITYGITIKNIINSVCISCHGAGADADFSTYASLSSYLAGNSQTFLNNINYTGSQHMPPSGKLDSCTLKKMGIWIHAGYPNN